MQSCVQYLIINPPNGRIIHLALARSLLSALPPPLCLCYLSSVILCRYFQFTGYALSLAVNWPAYVHVFLQLESSVGNANSFSYSDVECSFKDSLVFGSWFYTYCLLLLIVPLFMMFILVVVCSIADICCTHTKKNYKDNDDLESPKTSSDDNSDNSHSDQHSETLTQSTSSIRSRLINICVID